MRYRLNLLLAVLTVPVAAQRQQPPARGAAAITTEDVRRRIGVIAGSPRGAAALDSTAVTGKAIFLAYGPSVNAIAVKVLPLHPLALLLVADFPDSIWEKLPGHAASVRVRNPSEEGGSTVPAVFAVRAGTARGLFTRAGVPPDSLRVWGDRPLAAPPPPHG